MIIYKTRWFDRWACKEGLNDLSLCTAVNEMTAGLYEADLGGGLFKKRIAALDKVSVVAFVHWLPPTREIAGFLFSASRKTSAAILIKKKKKH